MFSLPLHPVRHPRRTRDSGTEREALTCHGCGHKRLNHTEHGCYWCPCPAFQPRPANRGMGRNTYVFAGPQAQIRKARGASPNA